MNIFKFFKQHIFRLKYHLIYASIAQFFILLTNILILVSGQFGFFGIPEDSYLYSILVYIIPTIFYTIFTCLFYIIYKNKSARNRLTKVAINAVLLANILYLIITIIDIQAGLYYIITTIIQLINVFFAAKFIIDNAKSITTGLQLVILKVFIYFALMASLLTLYSWFDNNLGAYIAWASLIISSALMFIAYFMYNSHFIQNRYQNRR